MILSYLLQPRVWCVLNELHWGDRFEQDLEAKVSEIEEGDQSFSDIRDRLLEIGLVYKLRGEKGSPYLALTYKGQDIVGLVFKAQEALQSEDTAE